MIVRWWRIPSGAAGGVCVQGGKAATTGDGGGAIHAVSDYKKRLYKKRLVEFKETKKRRLVTIYQAKKRNSKKRL